MSRISSGFAATHGRSAPWLVVAAAAIGAAGCARPGGVDDDETESTSAGLTTTLSLAADAYVRQTSPTSNYGTATTVNSDGDDGGSIVTGYVRFSVGNVGTITNAKLRVYVKNESPGPYQVRRVADNSWGETTVNWNNQPAVGALVATIGATQLSTWIDIDITSAVTANATTSLVIQAGTDDGFSFSSREASKNKPQIVLTTSGTGAGGAGGSAATGGAPGTGGTASGGAPGTGGAAGGSSGGPSTEANLKIAFVGDTDDGSDYTSVLNLVATEGAQALVTAGDMTYTSNPDAWWAATESRLGQSFPIFLARGNHDDASWSGFLPEAANHLGGATRTAGPHNAAYKTQFKGLDLVTIKLGDTATTVNNLFGSDTNVWKVCAWHQNQAKMQVGGKGDEMGWAVYEACRQKGAIIITGHEHTYHRTKTMTNTQTQTIDPTCSSGGSVCVGPGRTYVTVVGTGGTGLRAQIRCTPTASTAPFATLNTSDPSCPIWASIYTTNQGANYGAQFIVFNVDGNPKKAHAYFKNVAGQIIDSFDVFAD
jgi:predicted phosphodiesterase